MAQIVNAGANQVRLNSGQVVTAASGGWYDGQQYVNGTLSNPGQINPQSNQQGAGAAVSQQVVAQTNPNNTNYVNQQRANAGLPSSPDANNPAPVQQEAVINPNGGNYSGNAPVSGGAADGAGIPGGGVGMPGGTSSALPGNGGIIATNPTINLPDLYNTLKQSSGITDLTDKLDKQTEGYNNEVSTINDNPYLSEADRTGRIQKLTTDYNNNIKAVNDQIAQKTADIDMQIKLQTQQFDINSQAAKAALDQFTTLLQSGALNNASGQDIASITTATGLSSTMIQAAISAQQQKDVKTQVISYDDGTNQGFAVINSQTGAVISKQVVSASKPTKGSSAAPTASDNKAQALVQLPQDMKSGMTLGTAMSFYEQFGLTPQEIYNQYKAVNYYKATSAQQTADKKRYNVK